MMKQNSQKRKDISLRLLDQIVEQPASMRRFLKENPTVEINEIFNVTPHSVEGMEWTSSMLQRACSKHLVESVTWLLDHGADPNAFRDNVEDINSIPPITLCILHAISSKSRAAAIANIRLLVAYGAHLNHETECSSYPLECAASIITPRSPRDTWDLSMCLVELGAHTRHLAPNMFSAPPETLVRELKRIEKERQASMKGALAFTLQCTNVPRTCAISHSTTHSISSAHSDALTTPKVEKHRALSRCNSPFTSLSQGPLSQMGLVPSTPPPQSSTHIQHMHVCSTPTPPRSRLHVHSPYVYSTPTGPKDLSRKRSFAQIPWAPFLQHKTKKRRIEKVAAPSPLTYVPSSELTEFATPKRNAQRLTSQGAITPSSSLSARKKQRLARNFPSVQVSADVQRIILDFALPISHTAYRKARINTLMSMKSKRDRGHVLSRWFCSGNV